MSRTSRAFQPGYCYHITTRCNNREFRLIQFECREVLLFAIRQCREKFGFKLYALCIMSNHVHYLLEPVQPDDVPSTIHWLNWYTAMCFNRLLNRTGHFWEKRYHSTGFPNTEHRRALNTLRYIHSNPKAANMQQGWFYDFSNYGSYVQDKSFNVCRKSSSKSGEGLSRSCRRWSNPKRKRLLALRPCFLRVIGFS